MQTYKPEDEQVMRHLFNHLNEKERRLYAGVEALKLGHGGRSYIASVLGCSRRLVGKGTREVRSLSSQEVQEHIRDPKRIRKPGGGRKSYQKTHPLIDEKFLQVLCNHTAGEPMDEGVLWTDLEPAQIVKLLWNEQRILVSKGTVRKLLKKHNYRKRKAQKKQTMKEVPQRNKQFNNINRLVAKYRDSTNPIISMDTKKKEHLGNFYREGQLYTLKELKTFDHDFKNFAQGVIIPHSFYDLKLNTGYIQIGTSHD